jgi:hypothetical protein
LKLQVNQNILFIELFHFSEDIGGFDAEDIDRDLIAERLKQDAVSFIVFAFISWMIFTDSPIV